MALDVTVEGANANSYATLAEALAYINSHAVPATVKSLWDSADNNSREGVMIRAAQLLDRHVVWRGTIFGDVQALSWPRAWATDRHGREIASTVVPAFLKEFQIETALWLLSQGGESPEVGNAEYDSIRVGQLEIDFNEQGGSRRNMLPEAVIAALEPMGSYNARTAGGLKTSRLTRV